MARPRRPRDPIQGVPTSVAAFVGALPAAAAPAPALVTSLSDFERAFGTAEGETADAVRLFFENGGRRAYVAGLDELDPPRSLEALTATRFGLLVVPATARLEEPAATSLAVASALFAEERGAFYVVDPPASRTTANVARWAGSFGGGKSSAVVFPRVQIPGLTGGSRDVPSAGAVAGVLARTDIERGVSVSPSGQAVRGIVGPSVELDEAAVERLVQARVNPIRFLPGRGFRLWSALTRADTDTEWKYVNVRRLAVFLEESIGQGLQWVVFEPNRPPLWTQARAQVNSFLQVVFRQGAFPASKPEEAFFVRCDRTTMTQEDIDSGRLVIVVGIAPVRPAEFVILRIGLWARSPDDDEA
jgi:Bacteriophage tail sheath protein